MPIQCDIVTQERMVFSGQVDAVNLPGSEGRMGILPHHSPLLTTLDFGEFGKQGTGYHIHYLIDRLTEILRLTHEWPVALIGAGFLGHALASYRGFQRRGFVISGVFDNDPAKVGETIGDLTVRDMSELAVSYTHLDVYKRQVYGLCTSVVARCAG